MPYPFSLSEYIATQPSSPERSAFNEALSVILDLPVAQARLLTCVPEDDSAACTHGGQLLEYEFVGTDLCLEVVWRDDSAPNDTADETWTDAARQNATGLAITLYRLNPSGPSELISGRRVRPITTMFLNACDVQAAFYDQHSVMEDPKLISTRSADSRALTQLAMNLKNCPPTWEAGFYAANTLRPSLQA